jgi:uncharacterized membrane protein
MNARSLSCLAAAAVAFLILAGCGPAPDVSYAKDVSPILDKHCKSCYETLMKGTQYGPVVLPGDPLTSVLVMLIEGRADPSLKMPHGNAKPLEPAEIATIRKWVEQGAKNN